MDPTKSFDHLDPKLKETYARVMGTATNGSGDTAQNPPATQPVPSDTALSATPSTDFAAVPPANDPTQFTASPLSAVSPAAGEDGPNPGTGPTINTLPTDAPLSSPWGTNPPPEPAADTNSPATSSFFSNPSPATSDPSAPLQPDPAAPIDPPAAPITPYAPEDFATQNPIPTEQYAQPLPSPSSVNQAQGVSPLLRVLYIVGAVIFFAVYTIFWIKVFNLPFLF